MSKRVNHRSLRLGLVAITLVLISSVVVAQSTPTLGNYPNTMVVAGANTTVTPDAAPASTTRINVSSNSNFKGTFVGSPATGIVRVTNARQVGTYLVTVKAFSAGGGVTSKTFTLTVTNGTVCNGTVQFANAADVVVGSAPFNLAVGDFNNDGNQDVAAANLGSGTVSIRLGNGSGGFSGAATISVGATPYSVAIGDFNNDGNQDFAAASSGSSTVAIRLGDGLGGFSGAINVSVGASPQSVAIGDFNNDGIQDFATANFSANTVSIRLGDGSGGFSGATNVAVGTSPRSVAIGDFNNDGNQDFAAGNESSNTVSIRLGDGLGGFSSAADISVGAVSVAIGDFNNDGKQDLASANISANTVSIRLGDGLGGFSGTTNVSVGVAPRFVAIGDFNNDGKQDFATANQNAATVSIRLGDGLGGFSGTTNVSVGTAPAGVAIGDFNNDGRQDFATANSGTTAASIRLGGCAIGQLLNISTRLRVLTDEKVLIGGFIITGTDPKRVIIRGIGPSLGGVSGALADPTLELHQGSATIAANDNWKEHQAEVEATTIPPKNDLESAIVAILNPGAYTAILLGKDQTTGIGLVEAYDLNQTANSKLANISTRGFVDTGDDVIIGGFIVGGGSGGSARVIVRAIGPSLATSGIGGTLPDPTLELHNGDGSLITANDNWKENQRAEIEATTIPPNDDRESAIVASLPAGNYTAIVRGKNNTTGVGLVEVYNIP